MKKSIIFFVAILINSFAFGQTIRAARSGGIHAASMHIPACPVRMNGKKGKVYSVAPGIFKTHSYYEDVNVRLKKTGGKARTQVNIYVNGRLTKKIKFDNGDYTTDYKTRKLTNVKGKDIKVEIVNQSVGNTFSYDLKLEGMRNSLISQPVSIAGLLFNGRNNPIKTGSAGSCTGKAKIVFHRSNGFANVTINVYEKRGRTYSSSPIRVMQINGNESDKTFTVNSSKPLRIVTKNVSSGKLVDFTLNVIPAN